MQKLFALLLIVIGLSGAAGCSSPSSANPLDSIPLQGQVDASLPPQQQDQQRGMQLFLIAVQEGAADPAGLALLAPVDFRNSFPDFFGSHQRLVRWAFNGPPQGTDVPVTLYFDSQTSGPADPDKLHREDRVYYVIRAGQRFTIARKN